jgi:predicted ArsR family transcriptional regulator
MDTTEQKRGRGRPRKYFTPEEKEAARKCHRATFAQKVKIKTINVYGEDLELLRELAARSETSLMKCFHELVRKAKEDSDAVS